MVKNNTYPLEKPKILKVSRNGEFKSFFHPVLDKTLEEKYHCVGTHGEFLYDLFGCLIDIGTFIEKDLAQGLTYFAGNSHTAAILSNNNIKIEDDYGTFCYEMKLEEFLRINKEYEDLWRSRATDITFKIIDGKVILEGFWSDL